MLFHDPRQIENHASNDTWMSGRAKETVAVPSFSDVRSTSRCKNITCSGTHESLLVNPRNSGYIYDVNLLKRRDVDSNATRRHRAEMEQLAYRIKRQDVIKRDLEKLERRQTQK